MKRTLILATAVLAVGALACLSYADLTSSATAHVRVLVSPNVGLTVPAPNVDAGSVQTGDFSAEIIYRVDANKQEVSFYCEASPLYKANDPTGSSVLPIPLNLSAGIDLTPANGAATGGHSNNMAYIGPGEVVDGYPTQKTETVEYSSSQNNHFSQDVTVKVWWNQDDPEKPTGEYSGVVRLTALIIP